MALRVCQILQIEPECAPHLLIQGEICIERFAIGRFLRCRWGEEIRESDTCTERVVPERSSRRPRYSASPRSMPISSRVSRSAAARRVSIRSRRRPPGNAICPDQGSPSRSVRSMNSTCRLDPAWRRSMATAAVSLVEVGRSCGGRVASTWRSFASAVESLNVRRQFTSRKTESDPYGCRSLPGARPPRAIRRNRLYSLRPESVVPRGRKRPV